jgi:TonB-dependent receptor
VPFRGNVGVRYEHTHQRVDGNITAPRTGSYTTLTQAVGGYTLAKDYGNALPSLNLVLEPSKTVQLRFAAAKVLVRPILDTTTSMAQVSTTTVNTFPANTNTVTVDLGQANVKPLTANQLDLGVEWYYDKTSGISINGFYKWVKNGSYSALVCPSSFKGTSLSGTPTNCTDAAGNIYNITQTLNDASTVQIRGIEASINQSFDRFLPIKGFGVQANYTHIWPKQAAIGTGYTIRNLSKDTWNATGYWENDTFSFRASANYRSSYDQNSADSFFAYAGHTVRARTQVDLAAGYSYSKHLSFSAGVINLNNASEQAYYQNANVWQESSQVGRSYYASASYKF